MMAGTSRSKWEGTDPGPEQWISFLATLIASRVAQCTEAARSKGGSPEAKVAPQKLQQRTQVSQPEIICS